MRLIKNKKGETLIEVVLGLSLLTAVLVGAYILSNQATRITQEANERTEVSNLMRQQVEVLTAIESDHKRTGSNAQWTDILTRVEPFNGDSYSAQCEAVPTGSGNNKIAIPSPGVTSFVLDPTNDFAVGDGFNGVSTIQDQGYFGDVNPATGVGKYTIWTEAYQGDISAPGSLSTPYIDVYVTSCWERIGGGNIESSGLVVRFSQ